MRLPILAVLGCAFLLAGCRSRPETVRTGPQAVFSGVIVPSEPSELPPSSSARVSLIETGAPGETARTLATAQIMTRGRQFPMPFRIVIEEKLLKPGRNYSLAAAVAVGGQLRFVAMPPLQIDPASNRGNITVTVSQPQAAAR